MAAAAAAAVACNEDPCANVRHPPCGDETHETQATAETVSSDDGTAIATTNSIDPDGGAHWYTYEASADFLENIDPEVYLKTQLPAKVCAYSDCGFSACPPGSSGSDVAPGGQLGCCAEGTDLHFQIMGCSQSTATVWMSVEPIDPVACDQCVAYELDYNW